MKKFTLPDWTKDLPDTSYLDSKDLVKIFNYKNLESFKDAMKRKMIPIPDSKFIKSKSNHWAKGSKTIKNRWLLGSLRKIENNFKTEEK